MHSHTCMHNCIFSVQGAYFQAAVRITIHVLSIFPLCSLQASLYFLQEVLAVIPFLMRNSTKVKLSSALWENLTRYVQCRCVCFGAVYDTIIIFIQGIACNMESPAFKYLHEATMEELGESKPFSMCGSLPLVGDMQEAGFDVQVRDLQH